MTGVIVHVELVKADAYVYTLYISDLSCVSNKLNANNTASVVRSARVERISSASRVECIASLNDA